MTQIADRPARPDETLAVAVSDITQSLTMVQAINRALYDAMAADERVLVFGEDVAVEGGVFRVTEGLADTFGADRCFDTPLAESAIIGIAVGHYVALCRCQKSSSTAFPIRLSTKW